jgi:homoserine kinase type II
MAEWRKLAEADVRAILRDFGVAGYRAHLPIAVGTINTNVRVETDEGPLFLRINEGKSLDDVGREAAIVAHVAARGVPTPVPRATPSGPPFVLWRDQIVSLFPWVAGRTLERAELTAEHGNQAGAALGRLHLAGADYADRRAGRYEPDEIDRRLTHIAGLGRSDLMPAQAILTAELAALAGERAGDLPRGVIHGDLFVDNVLYLDDQLAALLDFEQASWGRLAYDLAVTVLAFGFGRDDFRPDVTRALIDGYAAVRPPTPAERAAFGAELRFAACRFAVTRITDVHLKQGAGAAPGKRYQRYLARLASVQGHLGVADGLLSL